MKVKHIRTERSHFPTIDGNTILDDPIDIADRFADFWGSIGSDEMFETDFSSNELNYVFSNVKGTHPREIE